METLQNSSAPCAPAAGTSTALVISYFAVVLLVTWLANLLNKNKG